MKYILFFSIVCSSVFSQTQKERDFILSKSNPVEVAQIKADFAANYLKNQRDIQAYLAKHPNAEDKAKIQRIIDGIPIYYQEDNNVLSVQTLRANAMYPSGSLGLSVTGQGMTVGLWDGGKVRDTHVEFGTGRVSFGDAVSALSTHSTHVLGTILAAGVSPLRRGFAYQASAITYDFSNDGSEILSFASQGYLVSNHSYGNIASNLQESNFGAYNSQSIEADNIMATYPYFQMVKSAGNDRSDTTLDQVNTKGGYDLLSGAACAKNILTIAAVEGIMANGDDNSFVMSTFSNFGPTDDGRIKPDLSAKGVSVSSCISVSDNAYSELSGTSMASPSITGLITLLQKHYNNLNPGTYMRSATVRALLIQSAREAGDYDGPDYKFGWGLPDGQAAAQIITNRNVSTLLEEDNLINNQTFTKTIAINSVQNLNVAIDWTDPKGIGNISGDIDNRSPRLINNLDLKVIKDGTTYYPWKLDPDLNEDPATNISDNDVDNIERIDIPNAQPGTYTIQVTHKGTLSGGSQAFSLVASGSGTGLGLDSRDFDDSVYIYPNPAHNFLNVEAKNNVAFSGITINDVSGKEIYKSVNSITNSIDVSNLSSGVYFITFKSDSNLVTKKFIKE